MAVRTTALSLSLLLLLLITALPMESDAKCVMTQTCVNPGNVPDYDACIPEAHAEPVKPQPMVGAQWANGERDAVVCIAKCCRLTGGGACVKDADCSDKGACTGGKCVCQEDGMVAGAHCELFAIQCPEYKDAACCSWQQNQGMAENFKLLASVFGKNSGGGCDACATNLLNLWCGIVCSPRQSEFMQMHLPFPSTSYRPDPMTGEDRVKVLEMDVTLDKGFTCSIFDSCKNTAIASMSEGMKSSLGFLNYQMQTGAVGHGEYMHLHFANSNSSEPSAPPSRTGFDHHVLKCDNYSEIVGVESLLPKQAQLLPSIASTSEPKQCPCGACRSTCDARSGGDHHIKIESNPISLFDGFNGALVALVYGGIGAVALLLRWRKSR